MRLLNKELKLLLHNTLMILPTGPRDMPTSTLRPEEKSSLPTKQPLSLLTPLLKLQPKTLPFLLLLPKQLMPPLSLPPELLPKLMLTLLTQLPLPLLPERALLQMLPLLPPSSRLPPAQLLPQLKRPQLTPSLPLLKPLTLPQSLKPINPSH